MSLVTVTVHALACRAGMVRRAPLLRHAPSIAFRLNSSDPNAGESGRTQGATDAGSPSSPPATPQNTQRSVPPPRPIPRGMRVERVERLGEESWGGVARVDKTTLGAVSLKDKVILATGDVAALTVFASIGRASHHEALSLVDSLGTAAPFIVGWVGASVLLGGYTKRAIESPLKTAASAWITGIPSGLLVRSLLKGHLPETTFVAISMAFTGVFLVGWRSVYARYLAGDAVATKKSATSNRRGNPFEFISLLFSTCC